MPIWHDEQTANHKLESDVMIYANAAARTGATGLVAADNGKIAYQTDTGEYYRLTDYSGPTWAQIVIGSLSVGTPASGNALVYNGSNWVAGNVSAGQADSLIESFQNETGGTLSQLEAVYISGFDIPSGLATIAKADASNVSTMPSIGIVENDITTGNSGNVIISGLLGGVDTSSFSANDILYVSATTPGQLTATRPTGAADKVQELAEVIRSHATQGIIQVFGSGSAALLSNLPQNTAWVGDVNNAPTSTSVVLADGTVAMTGNLSIGDFNITNVGDIALDSISSDAGTSINVTLGTDAGDDFNVGSGKLVVEGDTSYVTMTGKLGVGTTTFSTRDKLIVDNGSTDFLVGLTAKTVSTQTGTSNSPVAILANNTNTLNSGVGLRFASKNGNGTDDVNLAQIFAIIEQASVGAVNHGGLRFTTTDGSGVVNAMAISKNGYVGIGISSPSAQLHIDQSSATGAKPVLYLDQADLSEEFIRFNTTVGAGNPVNTTALGAYYGRVRVYIEGVGAKWLALYD